MALGVWLAAAGVTLHAYWHDPAYRADDHRAAVRYLREHWRPGDVVLVNAGWPYTALTTYWDGPIATRSRLTGDLPATPDDPNTLVMVTTGHLDGDPEPGLGRSPLRLLRDAGGRGAGSRSRRCYRTGSTASGNTASTTP